MNCPACGHVNRPGARFCGVCSSALAAETACRRCGAANPPGQRFCDACGDPLSEVHGAPPVIPRHLADKIRSSRVAFEGERKQVTVLFADVQGSMDLQEGRDPEEWREVMGRFFQLLCDGVHRYEGHVTRFTGDGIMALFGAPIAHEDHSRRACYAAMHLLESVDAYANELRRTKGMSFSTRIGLNAGDVVVGAIGENLDVDYTAIGHTVGLAQRVESIAAPDRAYLTEHVAALVEGFFELKDLGGFELKGVSEPVGVYELVGVGPLRTRLDLSKTRGFSKFVGRTDEMSVLDAALRGVMDGDGQVVGVVGEPGVGKSRLCYEFILQCRLHKVLVRQATALAHATNVPFFMILELMRDVFGITERDSDLEARRKVAGTIVLLDPDLMDTLPLVFDFLGIPDPERPAPSLEPEVRHRQLQGIVRRISQARAQLGPRVTLLEDLHWIDPSSERILAHLVEGLAGSRTLLVCNFRPEYRAEWMQKSYYRQIPLLPLGKEAIDELLVDLLGADETVRSLAGTINDRTGGNPFFIEEVVQGLAESGGLDGERGAYRLAGSVERITIPQTVHAVLASRIDRLSDRDKSLLQTAAVIGQEFTESVLERVAEVDRDDLEAALRALIAAEFIYETALYPEPEYSFKHPLTQEVAYGTLLAERRRVVHAGVARAIEELSSERLDERAALLSGHWEAAGDALQAARWSRRAADWVGIRNRAEAVDHWRRAIDLLRGAPDVDEATELAVTARASLLGSGTVAGLLSDDEVETLYTDGVKLAAGLTDVRPLANLEAAYGAALGNTSAAAVEHRLRGLEIADRTDDRGLRASMRSGLALVLVLLGRADEAIAMCRVALDLIGDDVDLGRGFTGARPATRARGSMAYALMETGRMQEATTAIDEMERLARALGEDEDLALALTFRNLHDWRTGHAQRALARAPQARELLERTGAPGFRVMGHRMHASLLVELERWDEAREAIDAALGILRAGRQAVRGPEASILALLAVTQLGMGDPDEALATAEQAVDLAIERSTPLTEVQTRIHAARVTNATGALDRTREHLDRALEIVRETGTATYEPSVRLEYAELARLRGDVAVQASELQDAHRLYTEMGITKRAEGVERQLTDLGALEGH